MKYSKNGQNFASLRTLKMCLLQHAEHSAKDHTSLTGLDQNSLFFNRPLIKYFLGVVKF